MATTPATDTQPRDIPLNKFLASTDKKTRDKAIKNLATILSDPSRDALPAHEMAKLWKGIFYCFWMSDKPLVQQALAREIAELILTINSTSSSLAFLRGFWEMIVREWGGIDRFRVDKYYMLIRRFVNASFRLLMRTEWDETACNEYNEILTKPGGPLCPDDIRVPTSLAYHLADVYLEELDKSFADPSSESPLPVPLSVILQPFFSLAAHTPTNAMYRRVQSALFEPLISSLEPPSSTEHPVQKRPRLDIPAYSHLRSNACLSNPREEGPLGASSLKAGLLKYMFEVASDEETRDSNRRKMYAFWKSSADDEGLDDE